MTSSSADAVSTGYVTHERVTLSTNPTGTSYSWGMSAPIGSAVSRSALSSYDTASPTFIPDVAGVYVLTCTVDATTYTLRVTATSTSFAQLVEAVRFSPKTDASVPTPAAGLTMYYSSDQTALCVKDSAGDVSTIDLTAVP